jgi:hypothetical protein
MRPPGKRTYLTSELEEIDKLAKEPSSLSATRLQEIEATAVGRDRDVLKAARRALYKLKLAGITLARQTRNAETASESDPSAYVRSFVTAIDGAGNQLLLFLISDPDGGAATLIQILTNDLEGVKSVSTLRIARRDVEERISRFNDQFETGLAVAETEVEYVRWLLAESRKITARQHLRSPAELLHWMPRIGDPKRDYTPPIYDRISPEALLVDESIDTDPGKLFDLPWFEPWFFAAEETTPWLFEWEEITGQSDLSESERSAEIERVEHEAAEGLMTPEMRKVYQHRLEESAEVLWRCDKPEEAKIALWHAVVLAQDTPVTGVPFVREIVHRTLGAALEIVRIHREHGASGQ